MNPIAERVTNAMTEVSEEDRVREEKSRSQYPPNRSGQRAYESDMRKATKQGSNLTPPKKRKKGVKSNGKH